MTRASICVCVNANTYIGKKKVGIRLRTIRDFCCILPHVRSAQPGLGYHRHIDEQLLTEILKHHVIVHIVAGAGAVLL